MMPIAFEEWRYLWPPRPDNAIPQEMLPFYEKKGWWAQYKKNGTCSIIGISPDKEFHCMNRHNSNHKTWSLTSYHKEQLTRLFPEKKWIVLVAEILHLKTPSIKDTIYIFDVIVWDGFLLFDSLFSERCAILDERLIPKATHIDDKTHFVCDSHNQIWYAKRFESGFVELFHGITEPKIDEGLVLKNPNGKLRSCMDAKENASWQVKCRKTHKNYAF